MEKCVDDHNNAMMKMLCRIPINMNSGAIFFSGKLQVNFHKSDIYFLQLSHKMTYDCSAIVHKTHFTRSKHTSLINKCRICLKLLGKHMPLHGLTLIKINIEIQIRFHKRFKHIVKCLSSGMQLARK